MKTFKKIGFGLIFFVMMLVGITFLHSERAAAYTPMEYWQECAYDVAHGNSYSSICSVSSNPSFSYHGKSAQSFAAGVDYQVTYPSSNTTSSFPNSIVLKKAGTSQNLFPNPADIDWTVTLYIQSGTTTTNNINFAVYEPGPSISNRADYSFLADLNNDSTLHILALVYNKVQSGDKVLAVKIDKDAIGTNQPAAAPPGTTAAAPTCESSSSTGLEWIMCPLFKISTSLADNLLSLFEGQLCFKASISSTASGTSCKTFNATSIQPAWSAIKNIVSALLVVIMLIAVFAQATSIGPIDAYTLRKLIPKLVAAVILIQISFYLFSWIVNLVDDVGEGLSSLLSQVFPGDINDFYKLLAHAGIGDGTASAANWVGMIAGITLGIAALPTLLMMIFAAGIGLLVALAVLIFRKVLIIALLIMAPLALLLWVLPGTERYWKMWWDNFIKALLMFPIVIAIIEAGRIFAWTAGAKSASGGEFISMLIIIVGFFGPLFILPKAFRWGGSLMQTAGGAINSVGSKVNKGMEQPIKGFGERYQGKWAKKYNPEAGLASRTARRIQSGHILPTKRSQRLAIAKGDKWQAERDEEALALINRKGEKAREGYRSRLFNTETGKYQKYARNNAGQLLNEKGKVVDKEEDAAKIDVSRKEESDFRTRYGVAAMKQMWVDLAESGRDDHEKKMAVKKLIATSSWPEVQGSFTESGKRVIDTDAWRNMVTTSEEDYPKVLRSRVDAAPHIIDSANREAEKRGYVGANADTIEARDFKSSYRINYAIDQQMSNEDFATQSDGFWQEAARVANLRDAQGNLTADAITIRQNLRKRLKAIHDIGGTAPQQLLGHLKNGGALQESVDSILSDAGVAIGDYLDTGPGKVVPGAEPTVAATPSGRTYETGNIEGGQRTTTVTSENIQSMSPENAANWVQSQGGYERMSNQDLVAVYNNYGPLLVRPDATPEQRITIETTNTQRAPIQQAARDALIRRGMFNPQGPNLPPDVEPPAAPPAPSTPPSGGGVPPEGELDITHGPSPQPPAPGQTIEPGIKPEEFWPRGNFPPPNIPPGPNNP